MKAIFLTGGPGSGKDVVLKHILSFYELKEYKLEQISKIVEKNNQDIIISAAAENFEKIYSVKNLLENFNYEVSMIFVDVSGEISRNRLLSRKQISEEIWRKKFVDCKNNIDRFSEQFNFFILFENNEKLQNANFSCINVFCESFLYLENNLKINNKNFIKNKSIKSKLLKNYPIDLMTKVKSDRIGDEYLIRNSGMGFPSTVGPFYNESFSEYESELPAFASDSRSIPNQEKYSDKPETSQKKSIKTIKKMAIKSWENKE